MNPLIRSEPPSIDEALTNAARLLQTAENETDRGLMAGYVDMAHVWTELANIQNNRD